MVQPGTSADLEFLDGYKALICCEPDCGFGDVRDRAT